MVDLLTPANLQRTKDHLVQTPKYQLLEKKRDTSEIDRVEIDFLLWPLTEGAERQLHCVSSGQV